MIVKDFPSLNVLATIVLLNTTFLYLDSFWIAHFYSYEFLKHAHCTYKQEITDCWVECAVHYAKQWVISCLYVLVLRIDLKVFEISYQLIFVIIKFVLSSIQDHRSANTNSKRKLTNFLETN